MNRKRFIRPLLVVAALLTTGAGIHGLQAKAADLSNGGATLDAEEKAFVTLINQYRAANGLGALQVSVKLTQAAMWMSTDLSKDSTSFDHTDSLGRDPFVRMKAFGYSDIGYAGENIAAGFADATATFEQWRTSPGHDANMRNPHYTTIGIARATRAGSVYGWYWTNDFSSVADTLIADPPAPAPTPPPPPSEPPLAIPADRSVLVPVTPARILDTRAKAPVPAGGTVTLKPLGQGGVPLNGVTAVVLTVTITKAKGAGFVSVYPGGGGRPQSSNLNVEGAGQTVANLVTVPVGTNGEVVLYSSSGGDLLADVNGYYAASGSTATAGRFRLSGSVRLLDTRGKGPVTPKGTRTVVALGQGGVPMRGVSAVSVNITVVSANRAGFLTAYPTGSALPAVSNLNVNRAKDTVAGAAIVPVDAKGSFDVFVDSGGDLIVDINGWFTDASAPAASGGIFVAQTPARMLDTRSAGMLSKKSTKDVTVPSGAIAVSANLTLTGTSGAGFLTAYAADGNVPTVSSVNAVGAGRTVANHAIVPASGGGARFFADMQTNLIVDYDGYYLADGA